MKQHRHRQDVILDRQGIVVGHECPCGWFEFTYLGNANQGRLDPIRLEQYQIYRAGGKSLEDLLAKLGGKGWVEAKTIRGQKYYYWRWRENGKKKSKFLGKVQNAQV